MRRRACWNGQVSFTLDESKVNDKVAIFRVPIENQIKSVRECVWMCVCVCVYMPVNAGIIYAGTCLHPHAILRFA